MGKAKTKICSACREKKPLTEFHRNGLSRDGRMSYCKKCRSLFWKTKSYKIFSLAGENKNKSLEKSASAELLNDCLASCLSRLSEIEDGMIELKANAEGVKTVIEDVMRANGLKSKELPGGSISLVRGKLEIRLK